MQPGMAVVDNHRHEMDGLAPDIAIEGSPVADSHIVESRRRLEQLVMAHCQAVDKKDRVAIRCEAQVVVDSCMGEGAEAEAFQVIGLP